MTTPDDQSCVPHSELKHFVDQMFKDSDVNHEAVFLKLQDLGVNSVNDLTFLEEPDLKDVLKPIQIRKFLKNVQEQKKEETGTLLLFDAT